MLYLTMHTTHYILQLTVYGVRHEVKDHSDSERKPAAATSWTALFHSIQLGLKCKLLYNRFQLAVRDLLYAPWPVLEHWLE